MLDAVESDYCRHEEYLNVIVLQSIVIVCVKEYIHLRDILRSLYT